MIALLLGIAAEGVLTYRNTMEAKNAHEIAANATLRQEAEAQLAQQKAAIELQTAKNAELLKAGRSENGRRRRSAQSLALINKNNVAKSAAEAEKMIAEADSAESLALINKTISLNPPPAPKELNKALT